MKIGETWYSKEDDEAVKILRIMKFEKYIKKYIEEVRLLDAIFDTESDFKKVEQNRDNFVEYEYLDKRFKTVDSRTDFLRNFYKK